MSEKLLELLYFQELPRVGVKSINGILNEIPDGKEACIALARTAFPKTAEAELSDAWERAEKINRELLNTKYLHILTVYDYSYPQKLRDLNNSKPLILYGKGNLNCLGEKSVSVVGSREINEWTMKVEPRLVSRLVKDHQRVIVSGLASGCDSVAHDGTIATEGQTVAVLAMGFNHISPESTRDLAEKVCDGHGCLISEYKPWENASKDKFVRRDDLIAAMGDALLVMQCGVKSGTMHTVDKAYELGRPIGVYYPDREISLEDYAGNLQIIENRSGYRIQNTPDLNEFISKI